MRLNALRGRIARALAPALAVGMLTLPAVGHANPVQERPSAMAMTGDAVLARPALLAMTVVGGAVYLVSLPFSLLGGNAAEAGDVLVVGPAKATFVRCLGCTMSGRQTGTVIEQQTN